MTFQAQCHTVDAPDREYVGSRLVELVYTPRDQTPVTQALRASNTVPLLVLKAVEWVGRRQIERSEMEMVD